MQSFITGQRWISDTETELGLGTVLAEEGRTVSILFLATGETRRYAVQHAPLTRVRFGPGDRVESREGWVLRIDSVREDEGLLSYIGTREDGAEAELPESELSYFIQFSRPQERLLAGQFDPGHWFDLRHETLERIRTLEPSPVRGLCGARAQLIPHQLYIAYEVARRHAPRVLLADEVGLGKTIEACLILHQQLITRRASRVLILVPETLVHQWLVELLRRFNLRFSIFDEERCQAIEDSGEAANPFEAEQLVLCSLDLFTHNPLRHSQAVAGGWDLMIVDEAHHLEWSEQEVSPGYRLVEQLAQVTRGLLLLTATPEQLGRAGHFARLRLLDPDRFHSLADFQEEAAGYRPVAEAVERLLQGEALSETERKRLRSVVSEAECDLFLERLGDPALPEEEQSMARRSLVELLLDRHGTGRVLFRNTRATVKGFPGRELLSEALPLPDLYRSCLERTVEGEAWQLRLSPERLHSCGPAVESWWEFDPRFPWLIDLYRRLRGEKILLICAHAATAQELAEALRVREGIHAALFHEGMSIVERDRAAAWFADPEEGARLMICSEIGSEGRNFQFAHHLVMFDLPPDPDLLEQRIGRLDRIGQTRTVQIHVPYLEGSPQELWLRWYHEGLNAFLDACPAGHSVFSKQRKQLLALSAETGLSHQQMDGLLDEAKGVRGQADEALRQGRDHLLELNSCRTPVAERIQDEIGAANIAHEVKGYMEQLFACYGVEMEEHSAGSYILRPGNQMQAGAFPGLPADGLTCTFARDIALVHEDRQFLSWEHPLVQDGMEMVLDGETGNSSVALLEESGLTPGTLLLETLSVLECPAPKRLHAGRFLPPTLVRVLLDEKAVDLSRRLPHGHLVPRCRPVERVIAAQVVKQRQGQIRELLVQAESQAGEQAAGFVADAEARMAAEYGSELERLTALGRVNPNVRQEEVEALREERETLQHHIRSSRPRLDAIRLLVVIS